MATGIVKGEKVGDDSLSAGTFTNEPFPLPPPDAHVTLSYPNKITETALLDPLDHNFFKVDASGDVSPAPEIEPNTFLLADNFFGLKHALQTLSGKISLVYLDPPFATGLDFHSRELRHAYGDKFNPATYVEFMRRRLILIRELLANDGSIYLHIGHQMLFHLKAVMDEVFGRDNFRNLIVRKKCSSKNYTRNQYSNLHDYILFFSKSKSYKWNQQGVEPSKDWIDREYPKTDAKGRYKLVPIHAPGIRHGETGKEWRGMLPPPGKHWQFVPAKLEELDNKGEIHWSKNDNPRRKVYLTSDKSLPLTDYWPNFRDAHHQSIEITGYPTEKNFEMLKVIVAASSDEGDIVLDPFAGSGTTLQAANELGRQWIGIDESLTAAQATIGRLRKGARAMGDYVLRKPKGKIVDLFGPDGTPRVQAAANFDLVVDGNFYANYPDTVTTLATI